MSVKLFCSPGFFSPRAISLRVKHVVLLKCRLLTTWGEGSSGRKTHVLWQEYQWPLSDPLKHPLQGRVSVLLWMQMERGEPSCRESFPTVKSCEKGWQRASPAGSPLTQGLGYSLWEAPGQALLATLGLGRQARTSLGESFFSFFNQRTVALQCCVGLCCTSAWISHRYIYVCVSPLSCIPSHLPLHPNPLSCHGALGWAPCIT